MGIATTQQINRYYEAYKNIEVVFSREITSVVHLMPRQIFVKCLGTEWPCIINSTSFVGAKIIIGRQSGFFGKLEKANSNVSLRFCFQDTERNDTMLFFVSGKVSGMIPYTGSQDLMIISISYTQRPPDDLIEIIGNLLDANINSAKRKEERVLITPESMRRMNILQKETVIFIQGVPRKCILRDVSFSGAKVILMGIAQFIKDKEVVLRIDFNDPRETVGLKGVCVRTEDVENRKELVAAALSFNEQTVPIAYKIRINNYLSQYQKQQLSNRAPQAPAPAADKAPDAKQNTGAAAQTASKPVSAQNNNAPAQKSAAVPNEAPAKS